MIKIKTITSTTKIITTGKYCLKNLHLAQKVQNLIVMELKNVKDDFIAYLGASGFKKSRIFMNLEGWKMLWNYLGYPNTLTL